MHFQSAETLVWKAVETTYKNEVIVYLLCSVNYEIKIFRFLRFSFDSPLYILPDKGNWVIKYRIRSFINLQVLLNVTHYPLIHNDRSALLDVSDDTNFWQPGKNSRSPKIFPLKVHLLPMKCAHMYVHTYITNSEIIPTRCNNCVYSSQWLYSTCFGWQFHPSSGVKCCIWPFR